MIAPVIRAAERRDAEDISRLLSHLGYPAPAADVLPRIDRIGATATATILVAEDDRRVVGVATGHLFHAIHQPAIVAWLTALVVDRDQTGRGVGRALVAAIEAWARANGATRISVSSGEQRQDAHAFYDRLGYRRSGIRLSKTLADAGSG